MKIILDLPLLLTFFQRLVLGAESVSWYANNWYDEMTSTPVKVGIFHDRTIPSLYKVMIKYIRQSNMQYMVEWQHILRTLQIQLQSI